MSFAPMALAIAIQVRFSIFLRRPGLWFVFTLPLTSSLASAPPQPGTDVFDWLAADLHAVCMADALNESWKEKIIHNAVRPLSAINDALANETVTAHVLGAGVQEIKGSEWSGYLRTMPHGEFACSLELPVEAENILETKQPSNPPTNSPITDHYPQLNSRVPVRHHLRLRGLRGVLPRNRGLGRVPADGPERRRRDYKPHARGPPLGGGVLAPRAGPHARRGPLYPPVEDIPL